MDFEDVLKEVIVDDQLSIRCCGFSRRIAASDLPDFMTLLLTDDLEQFKSWSALKQFTHIHGYFDYGLSQTRPVDRESHLFGVPFNLVVGHGALRLTKHFLRCGVEVTQLDIGFSNILHVLSICAGERYRPEDEYVDIGKCIIDNLSKEQFRVLCYQENSEGFRPLELASKLGVFGIFRLLLLTPGFIVGSPRILGIDTTQSCDLSAYEDCSSYRRMIRSPLRYMVFVSRKGLASLTAYDIMELPIIRRWINYKIRHVMIFLIMWWLLKCSYVFCVAGFDPSLSLYPRECRSETVPSANGSAFVTPTRSSNNQVGDSSNSTRSYPVPDNATAAPPSEKRRQARRSRLRLRRCRRLRRLDPIRRSLKWGIVTWTWYWGIVLLALDVLEFCLVQLYPDRRRAYRNLYLRDCAVYTNNYRHVQFLLYFFSVVAKPVSESYRGGKAIRVLLFMKIIQLPLCLMSFLHMVEFMPVFGVFAITLQRMMRSMGVFLFFLLPVKIFFTHFFMFFDKSKLFPDLPSGVYHLFLLDMGSVDFGENPQVLVKITHIFYFLVMVVLLFNYMIAVFAIVADHISDHERVFVDLRRLQMIFVVEERFTFWFWKFIGMFRERRPVVVFARMVVPERSEPS